MSALFEDGVARDGTMAQNSTQARSLWELRESISESLSATGLPHKNDIALPVARLSAFCAELDAVFEQRYPGWELCLFGHIGDGNLHVNVMKPDAMGAAGTDDGTYIGMVRHNMRVIAAGLGGTDSHAAPTDAKPAGGGS